ncbi:hypothetical protein [Cyanothece sp. BG0011]|uniref:hypothetical protein n=1 Tax=Cyanothece sp. BG0011 TaxID=2082950 RepID=UPI000D1E6C07|nr:hypothetical protein [Cyanothece sp. BG0011]
MDLLTGGATALLTLLAKQTYDATSKTLVKKTSDKLADIALTQANKILQLLKNRFPDKLNKLETTVNNSSDVIDAEVIEEVANQDDEIKKEIEKLGEMIQENSEAKQVIENWKGINMKGGTNIVKNNTLNIN